MALFTSAVRGCDFSALIKGWNSLDRVDNAITRVSYPNSLLSGSRHRHVRYRIHQRGHSDTSLRVHTTGNSNWLAYLHNVHWTETESRAQTGVSERL